MRKRWFASPLAAFGVVFLFGLVLLCRGLRPPWAGAQGIPSVHTVTSVGDLGDADLDDGVCDDGTGECTLRAAIEQANHTGGEHDVEFAIPGAGVHSIVPATPLPTIATAVRIRGETQPGATAAALTANGIEATIAIRLDGASVIASGLTFDAENCRVSGLSITGFGQGGMTLASGNCAVVGNFIGLAPDGSEARNTAFGVKVRDGSHSLSTNVISSHTVDPARIGPGIHVENGHITVVENYIGTDPTGTEARPNTHGVYVQSSGHVFERNLISANQVWGIWYRVFAPGSPSRILGNRIGTDRTGTVSLGGGGGIALTDMNGRFDDGARTRIGGFGPGEGNLISGNQSAAIWHPVGDTIEGNLIGVAADGVSPLGNDTGIIIERAAGNRVVGNTIANNGSGIVLLGIRATDTGHTIRGNSIYGNSLLGIDLRGEGQTLNDAGDADTGPNHLQNFPVLSAVVPGTGTTRFEGVLDSAPSSVYTLEFFSNEVCGASGYGEGRYLWGSADAVTDADGIASFAFSFAGSHPGEFYTATATAADGSTSEFCECLHVVGRGNGELEFNQATYEVAESQVDPDATGFWLPVAIRRTSGAFGEITVDFATGDGTAEAPDDYLERSGTATFGDDDVTYEFEVFVRADDEIESDETIELTLSSPTGGATLGAQQTAQIVILNDDVVSFAFESSSLTVAEDDAAVTARVTLTPPAVMPVTVDWETADGSARAGEDYSLASGSLRFDVGESQKDFSVTILQDDIPEQPETIRLLLQGGSGTAPGTDASATVSIEDDDDAPGMVQFSQPTYDAITETFPRENSRNLVIVRTGGFTGELRYRLELSGTAVVGEDFDFHDDYTVVFPEGVTEATRRISARGTPELESTEFVIATLVPLDGAVVGPFSSTRVIIWDSDFVQTVPEGSFHVVAPSEVDEGDALTIRVGRHSGDWGRVTVDLSVRDVTTTSGVDYDAIPIQTVVFEHFDDEPKEVTLQTLTDALDEGTENFEFLLSNATDGALISTVGVFSSIHDVSADPVGTLRFSGSRATVSEGAGTFTTSVSRVDGTRGEVRVAFATSGRGSRYVPVNSTLVFPDGVTSRSITVPLVDDDVENDDEVFTITLFSPTNGASIEAHRRQLPVTIEDDDESALEAECSEE